ncbi:MAG: kelch repeat-containing protein [Candidatus Odinarchaeota archaeon]
MAYSEYDSESDRIIIFGGIKTGTPYSCYNDTWAYDTNTNTWENKTPSVSPSARSVHGMAYDSESDRIVLYGGMPYDPNAPSDRGTIADTWAYDYNSNTWTNMSPATNPDLRYAFGFAYDSESDRAILFGGRYRNATVTEERNETWTYDYNTNTWTNMNPSVAPPIRNRFSMTYHAAWDKIILFGGDTGMSPNTLAYSDTWAYDYNTNTWTQLAVQHHPSARIYTDLAYDSESDCILLFGGWHQSTDIIFGDTWIFSESQIHIDPGPVWILIAVAAVSIFAIVMVVVYVKRR